MSTGRNIITDLQEKIQKLQEELDMEIAVRHAELKVKMEHGKAVFEEEVVQKLRERRISTWNYIKGADPKIVATAPLIYFGIFPLVLLHLYIVSYQALCFPAYGIPKVKVRKYFIFDRARAPFLNIIQKINCVYCSYGVGVIAAAMEVASLTEMYWCPLKHAKKMVLGYHERYGEFAEYGDAEGFQEKFMKSPEQDETNPSCE
jgi:hypothetical protein